MGQNYNLNSTFGLNVTPQGAKQQQKPEPQSKINIESKATDLFDSFVSFSPETEKVYNGEIEKEISKYTRQAMFVGMSLRNAEEKRHFDMKI